MENKPKLALFSRYPVEFETQPFGGFRKMIDWLLDYYEIYYCTMGWSKGENKELRRGINIIELPIKVDLSSSIDKWLKTILYYLLLPFAILKLKNKNPDIILSRENMPLVPLFLSLLNKPVFVEIGDWWPSMMIGSTDRGKKIARFIENFEVRLWNKRNITAITHNFAESKVVLEKGLAREKIRIVGLPMFGHNYYPCNASKERKELGFAKKDFVIATQGIIHRSKAYDQVLKWAADLVKIHPNWKFLFICGTMGEGWFNKMIDNLNLNKNVIITGWVAEKGKLNRYLNCADCLLVTRRNTSDNYGTTPSALPHSLMTGKPTIITGMPAVREIIRDRKNGYLFEPDNYNSFKDTLEEVYSNPKKAKKVGLTGLKRVKEYFSPEKSAEQYDSLFSHSKSI